MGKRFLGPGYSRVTTLITLAMIVVGVAILLWPTVTIFDRAEWRLVDWRFHVRGPIEPDSDIVIVAVDEASLAAQGRWPWPRRSLSALITKLKGAGARAILLDVFVAEPTRGDPQADSVLAAGIGRAGNVYLGMFTTGSQQSGPATVSRGQALSGARTVSGHGLDAVATLYRYPGLGGQLPELVPRARGVGYTDVIDYGDGVYRAFAPVAVVGSSLYAALGVTVAAQEWGIPPDKMEVRVGREVRLGDKHTIPIDRNGRTAINFVGGAGTFPYIPAYRVLAGDASLLEQVRGKYVLVAGTAPGLYDLRPTSLGMLNGAELQANILDNLLRDRFIRYARPEQTALLLVAICLCIGFAVSVLRTELAAVAGLAVIIGAHLIENWAFAASDLVIPFVLPGAVGICTLVLMLTYRLFVEERQHDRVQIMFEHFAPPDVVTQLVQDADSGAMIGDRRDVTILFSDLREFTTVSERLDPEDAVGLLNRYFAIMHEVIWEYGGTLDKFIGDGIMALFGAPLEQPDHPRKAVECAIAMQRQIASLHQEWAYLGMPDLRAGIGIASGSVVVGCMGSPGRIAYTAVGATVNLASRLEQLTKETGCAIIISGETRDRIGDDIAVIPLPPANVAGFAKPVQAWRVDL